MLTLLNCSQSNCCYVRSAVITPPQTPTTTSNNPCNTPRPGCLTQLVLACGSMELVSLCAGSPKPCGIRLMQPAGSHRWWNNSHGNWGVCGGLEVSQDWIKTWRIFNLSLFLTHPPTRTHLRGHNYIWPNPCCFSSDSLAPINVSLSGLQPKNQHFKFLGEASTTAKMCFYWQLPVASTKNWSTMFCFRWITEDCSLLLLSTFCSSVVFF